MAKTKPPPDLQSRYQSELDKNKRLKSQVRELESKKKQIQSIPEMHPLYPRASKAPPPITPVGAGLGRTTSRKGPRLPRSPRAESAREKGLSKIKKLDIQKKLLGARIWQSRNRLALMEMDAADREVELPARELNTAETVPKQRPSGEPSAGTPGSKPQSELIPIREIKTHPPLPGAPQSKPRFAVNQYGGIELCIVVSYFKAKKHNLKDLAKMLTYKGKIKYKNYPDALAWHVKNYKPTFPISTSDPCSSDLPVTNNQNLSALQPRNKCFSSYFG